MAGQDAADAHPEPTGEGEEDAFRVAQLVLTLLGVGAQPGDVAPEFRPARPPLNQERPAGENFSGIMFAGGLEHHSAGKGILDQLAREPSRVAESLNVPERGGLPLRALGLERDEGGFAAHRELQAGLRQQRFDRSAARTDFFPNGCGVGGGHASFSTNTLVVSLAVTGTDA